MRNSWLGTVWLGAVWWAGCVALVACGGGGGREDAGEETLDAFEALDVGTGDAHVAPDAFVEGPLVPIQVCPGPGCETSGGVLEAGASAVAITPEPGSFDLVLGPDGLLDDDHLYEPGRDADTIEDTNGNGRDDPAWMAGFAMGRAATGVHDDQWARALALRSGETTVVFCVIDSVGYMINEMDAVRAMVPPELGVDHVFMAATHTHQARDTVGIWGPDPSATGLDPGYLARVRERAVQAIREAVERLTPATMELVSFRLGELDLDPETPGVQAEVRRFVGDSRDPFILDDQVRMMRFVRADGGEAEGTPPTPDASGSRAPAGPRTSTIATWVNFATHPEYMGSRQRELSSDLAHYLRATIERGADGPDADDAIDVPGVGGVALFWNGAQGVQIGPNRLLLEDWDGSPVPTGSVRTAEHVGTMLGYWALRALDPDDDAVPTRRTILDGTGVPIAFRRARFFVRVQNTAYHIALFNGLFDREVFHYEPGRSINFRRNQNIPEVETELAVIRIGPAELFTMPGELDPLLFVGTEGERAHTPASYNGGDPIDATLENAPRLPAEGVPHVLELRDADVDRDDVWLLGLTNDYLGYFVPEFDYQLHDVAPFLVEAPGRHYDETNSIGPEGWPRIFGKLEELVRYEP